jgi:hypothetical protein
MPGCFPQAFRPLPRLDEALDLGNEGRMLGLKRRVPVGGSEVVRELLAHEVGQRLLRAAVRGDLRPFYGAGPLSSRTPPAIIQVDSCFIQTGRGVASPDEAHQPAAEQHGGRRSGSARCDDEGGSVPPSLWRP